MKTKTFLLAIVMSVGSLRAQVGIGTKTPQSMLDVNGNITMGFEENNPGEQGMMRWNKEKTCFEGHDGKGWKCLENKLQYTKNTVVSLYDGKCDNNTDYTQWADDDIANTSKRNIVKLDLKLPNRESNLKSNLYDESTGTINIDQEGTYKITYKIVLGNNPQGATFNGDSGTFITWITKNDIDESLYVSKVILKGVKPISGNNYVLYYNNDSQVIYLKKGDKINVRFATKGTASMSENPGGLCIRKELSSISLKRL